MLPQAGGKGTARQHSQRDGSARRRKHDGTTAQGSSVRRHVRPSARQSVGTSVRRNVRPSARQSVGTSVRRNVSPSERQTLGAPNHRDLRGTRPWLVDHRGRPVAAGFPPRGGSSRPKTHHPCRRVGPSACGDCLHLLAGGFTASRGGGRRTAAGFPTTESMIVLCR